MEKKKKSQEKPIPNYFYVTILALFYLFIYFMGVGVEKRYPVNEINDTGRDDN